jgi:hypothetical protein
MEYSDCQLPEQLIGVTVNKVGAKQPLTGHKAVF